MYVAAGDRVSIFDLRQVRTLVSHGRIAGALLLSHLGDAPRCHTPQAPLLNRDSRNSRPREQVAAASPAGGASSSSASAAGALAVPLRQLPPREEEVNSLAIDAAEKYLATADDSGCIQARALLLLLLLHGLCLPFIGIRNIIPLS